MIKKTEGKTKKKVFELGFHVKLNFFLGLHERNKDKKSRYREETLANPHASASFLIFGKNSLLFNYLQDTVSNVFSWR